MDHQGTKQLESDRLLLRQFRIDDADAMFVNWASNPEVVKYLIWPCHENVEASKKILADWVRSYSEEDYYQWAIVLKENGDMPIGSIGGYSINAVVAKLGIGYCIGRAWWRQGVTSEALSLLIRYFFDEVGANRIEARHDPRNENSGKVMLKCGMRYEGTLRQADWNNQGVSDSSVYAILRGDYNSAADF